LTVRAVAYSATRELVPLYGGYGLLFEDNGLSTAQISSLFAVWSIAAFVTEVPSGAWADIVPRRTLLFGSAVLLTASFTLCWCRATGASRPASRCGGWPSP